MQISRKEHEVRHRGAQMGDSFGEIRGLQRNVALIAHKGGDEPPVGRRPLEQQDRLAALRTPPLVDARVRVAPECRRLRHGEAYRRAGASR